MSKQYPSQLNTKIIRVSDAAYEALQQMAKESHTSIADVLDRHLNWATDEIKRQGEQLKSLEDKVSSLESRRNTLKQVE